MVFTVNTTVDDLLERIISQLFTFMYMYMYMSHPTCTHYYSYVVSELYSRVPGDCNWRHRVADIHIFVNGLPCMLPRLQELLGGKQTDLD